MQVIAAAHVPGCCCDRCWPATLRATLAAGARRLAERALALLDADVAPAPSAPRRRRRRKVAPPQLPTSVARSRPARPEICEPIADDNPEQPAEVAAESHEEAAEICAEICAPAPARTACRVCGEDDANERVQPDLHRRCLEEATDRALERTRRARRRPRVMGAGISRTELIARLARDRGAPQRQLRRPAAETDRDDEATLTSEERDAVDAIARGGLATSGLGAIAVDDAA